MIAALRRASCEPIQSDNWPRDSLYPAFVHRARRRSLARAGGGDVWARLVGRWLTQGVEPWSDASVFGDDADGAVPSAAGAGPGAHAAHANGSPQKASPLGAVEGRALAVENVCSVVGGEELGRGAFGVEDRLSLKGGGSRGVCLGGDEGRATIAYGCYRFRDARASPVHEGVAPLLRCWRGAFGASGSRKGERCGRSSKWGRLSAPPGGHGPGEASTGVTFDTIAP